MATRSVETEQAGGVGPIPAEIETASSEGRLTIAPASRLATTEGVAIPATDCAMLAVMPDLPLRQRLGAPAIPDSPAETDRDIRVMWEGAEHTYLGNNATLRFDSGDAPAARSPLYLSNGLALTYGQIVALGGDFYGIPDKPISATGEHGFLNAYNTLGVNPAAAQDAPKILAIMQIEIDAVNKAIRDGQKPSTAYERIEDLTGKWNAATGGSSTWPYLPQGRYLKLAATNWDHFGTHAIKAYANGHAVALKYAMRARTAPTPAAKRQQLGLAYAMNAFADHFLTDLFSAGHLRTPRKALYDTTTLHDLGSLCAWYMHEEDCCWGLNVSNARGETWKAYGDKRLLDAVNHENLVRCEQAVQVSIDEVHAAYQSGTLPTSLAPLVLIPNVRKLADPTDRSNPSPLFALRDGVVQRRNDLLSRFDYTWSKWWTAPTTLEQLYVLPQFRQCGDPSC